MTSKGGYSNIWKGSGREEKECRGEGKGVERRGEKEAEEGGKEEEEGKEEFLHYSNRIITEYFTKRNKYTPLTGSTYSKRVCWVLRNY